MNRWKASGRLYQISDLLFRVQPGAKGEGDVKLQVLANGAWRDVKMELAFFLVDFFTSNEDTLSANRPHWRQSGPAYFLKECVRASREGWEAPARAIVRQRARKDAA